MRHETVVLTQDNDTAHELSARCDYCGTEHKFRVASAQHEDGVVEITIESLHGSITLYQPTSPI